MSEGNSSLRSLFSIALLGATGLGLYNVYGDPSDVERRAGLAGCGGQQCPFNINQASRNPLFHSYMLSVQPAGRPGRSVDVECSRAYYLLGEYACVVKSEQQQAPR